MQNATLVKLVIIAASLPLFAGCVERQVVYHDRPVYAQPQPAPVVVEEYPAPPPPQTEVVTIAPGPPDIWFWVPGTWEWRGRWVWSGGHWAARPYRGAVWVGPHWGVRGHHRVWIAGGWR
jgi:hypothetical protein